MERKINIKQYFQNFAISDQGDIYTWLPLPNPKIKNEYTYHLFPRLLNFKVPLHSKIIAISSSAEKPEMLLLNEKKEVLCFNLFTGEPTRKKLTLLDNRKNVSEMKATPELESLLILMDDNETIFYKSNHTYNKDGSFSNVKEYVEVSEIGNTFKSKVNAMAVTSKGYAVITDNKTLSLFGDIAYYTKHVRSSANKFTFEFEKNLSFKAVFFTEKKLGFVNESNQIYFHSEDLELKKTIQLKPRYAYNNFGFALSNLNHDPLNDHFIVSIDNKVYLLNQDHEPITFKPINIPLSSGEYITNINVQNLVPWYTRPSNRTAFALTNLGNLYGFGENNEFQIGVGTRTKHTIMDAIPLNPYLNKALDHDFFLSLVDETIEKKDHISALFKYIPDALKTNDDFILKLMIASNFDNNLRQIFNIDLDLLLKFIAIRSDLKYSFLNFDHDEFMDKTKLSSLSKIFPDLVFLYHQIALPVNTFETYLRPLLSSFNGKPISAKEINTLAKNIYEYGVISSNVINPLKEHSVNFHLALIKLGFHYDYIDYSSLATFILDRAEERTYFLSLPSIIRDKVQETCTISELPKHLSMNDLVLSLVELELIQLSERLMTKGLIPKTKFLQLFAKSPEMFTPRFNSFLLAAPKIVKTSKDNGLNLAGRFTIHAFESQTFFYDGDLLCVIGEEPEGLTNAQFVRHRKPFFFHEHVNKVSNANITIFAANNHSFGFVNEQQKIFLGGRMLRILALTEPKQGEEFNALFEISSQIKLNKDETVQKLLIPTERTIIVLTSQSRVILVYHEQTRLLINQVKKNTFSGQDLTPLLKLKGKESIKEIVSIDDDHLIYITNGNNLYLLRKEVVTKIDILLDHGEDIITIKLGGVGLLVLTNKGRLFMSDITIVDTYKIQNWNQLNYSPEPPHGLVPPQPLRLDYLNFPLEKDEHVLDYDVLHQHAAMVTNQGRVFLWGNCAQGAFGTKRFKFTHILDLAFLKKDEKVVKVFVGFQKTYVITNNHKLYAFGANWSGSLGDGTEVDRFEPVEITNKFKR